VIDFASFPRTLIGTLRAMGWRGAAYGCAILGLCSSMIAVSSVVGFRVLGGAMALVAICLHFSDFPASDAPVALKAESSHWTFRLRNGPVGRGSWK